MADDVATLKAAIRDVPDFPKEGILFKDITTLLKDPKMFRLAVDRFTDLVAGRGLDKVVAIESRGFIFGSVLADRIGAGFVPVRKPGKLPWKTHRASYQLEYGTDSLEIHQDAVSAGDKVLVVDDVIATGGTAAAVGELVGLSGATVAAYAFLVELAFLKGRDKLAGSEVLALIQY